LGLGSNLGDREANIGRAVELINERLGVVVRQSSLVETEPWGYESQNKFLNAVILCETDKTPHEVLRLTQKIERDLGKRKSHATRRCLCVPAEVSNQSSTATYNVQSSTVNPQLSTYHDRPIDIDILLYDDLHVDEPDLKIPHPLMLEREFVMCPLREIMAGDIP
jgi:2-amino-4-hydroxy-6-hydroxymethyldihydropteridine diphosphokinase